MSSMYPPRGGQTIQSCMRCGLPLLPDMPVCRNCGWYNALPPQQFVGSIPMAPAQNQQAGYNGFASAQPGMYYALPATSTGAFQPAMNGFAPGNYYQQSQPLQPEPEQKQGPNVLAILLVIVSILLLIGSGCIAGYFFLFKNQGQNTVAITPTVPVIVTPSIKPLFGDNFQGNTNKWIISSVPGQYSVSIGGGQMVLEDDHNQLLWEIVPSQTFSDFRLDVDAKLTKGDKTNGYGIYIRGIATQNSDIGQFYRFELYGDGTFGLFKGTLDANNNTIATSLTGRDLISNTAIQTEGATNHITIIARGSSMQFIVNNTPVYTLNDSSYKGGQIALFVSNISTAPPVAQAAFTHLAIFPVN